MPDRSYTIRKGVNGIYFRMEFGEVTVSLADTMTLDNFIATSNLLNVVLWKKSNGAEMTNTHAANNVITITGAGTDLPCIYMAYGVKA
jgi:hypothetical protein